MNVHTALSINLPSRDVPDVAPASCDGCRHKASGRVLRIDADEVTPATEENRFFSTVPQPARQKLDVRETVRKQQHKTGLAAVFGKWPGDETDEEIAQALQELS